MTYKLPKRAIIETEYTCNLKCKICSLWQKNYIKKRNENKILNRKTLKTIYKKLSDFSVRRITYIGGEPFLKNYILDTANDLKEFRIQASVVTNGTLLNENTIEKIICQNLFENIIFSIDAGPKTHNEIRGDGVFEKAYENLKIIRNLKNKKKTKKPKIIIYITIWDKNYIELEDTLEILLKTNPNRIRIQLASSITAKIIKKTNTLLPNSLKTHSYINNIKTENAFKWMKENFQHFKEKYKILNFEKIFTDDNQTCHFLDNDFIITPSGNILVCPMLTNIAIGNLYEEELKEFFLKNVDKIDLIKKIAINKKLPICYECCVEKIR